MEPASVISRGSSSMRTVKTKRVSTIHTGLIIMGNLTPYMKSRTEKSSLAKSRKASSRNNVMPSIFKRSQTLVQQKTITWTSTALKGKMDISRTRSILIIPSSLKWIAKTVASVPALFQALKKVNWEKRESGVQIKSIWGKCTIILTPKVTLKSVLLALSKKDGTLILSAQKTRLHYRWII